MTLLAGLQRGCLAYLSGEVVRCESRLLERERKMEMIARDSVPGSRTCVCFHSSEEEQVGRASEEECLWVSV